MSVGSRGRRGLWRGHTAMVALKRISRLHPDWTALVQHAIAWALSRASRAAAPFGPVVNMGRRFSAVLEAELDLTPRTGCAEPPSQHGLARTALTSIGTRLIAAKPDHVAVSGVCVVDCRTQLWVVPLSTSGESYKCLIGERESPRRIGICQGV